MHIIIGVLGSLSMLECSSLQTASGGGEAKQDIPYLVRQLGSDMFRTREAAAKRLVQIGEPALESLRKAHATNRDPEVAARASLTQTRIRRVFKPA